MNTTLALWGKAPYFRSNPFASTHSASISSSVALSGRRALLRQPRLDVMKPPLEFGVGGAQGLFGIDLGVAREIGDDEQEIADFLGQRLGRRRARLV